MVRKLLLVLLVGTMFLTACGRVNVEKEKIAVINIDKVISMHPDYAKLQKGETLLKNLTDKKAEQERIFQEQLKSLDKLTQLKKVSEKTFLDADFNTRMYAAQAKENFKLQKYQQQVDKEAEEIIAERKKSIEDEHQLKMFNIRMQLDSLRMSPDKKAALENDLLAERSLRDQGLQGLEAEKNAYIESKMTPYLQQSKSNMDQEAMRLRQQMADKMQNSEIKYQQMIKDAPPALRKILEIMNKEIEEQKNKNELLRQNINQDIEAKVKALAEKNNYSIVLKNVKVNIKGTDITDEVIKTMSK